MAIDIELTSAHDMKVTDDFHLIEDRLEVLQSNKIRLLFILAEWVFNFTLGIPWLTDMFDVRIPQIQKRSNLVKTIQGTPGTRALTAFEFNVDNINRGAFVSFEAETIYGPITQELEL